MKNQRKLFTLCLLLLGISIISNAQIRLPKLIGNGMVLQRNTELKIWGWASPNEKVQIAFNQKKYETTTNSDGKWAITLPKMKAGGPYTMTLKGVNEITLRDIWVGDVWVASGQSNMELPMSRVRLLYEKEIANAANPAIRFFTVPQQYDFNTPQADLSSGEWKAANPDNVLDFSAAAYFFAKDIHARYHVPVGIINSSLGGSPAQSWISEETLKAFPEYYTEAQRFKDQSLINRIESEEQAKIRDWYSLLRQKDEGYQNPSANWFDPNLNTTDWATMKVPGYWAETPLGQVNGVVWFRKEIELTAEQEAQPAKLNLSCIVDADSVCINGAFVGTTSYQYPPRWYNVPANVLKPGKNILVVRIISNSGKGGFVLDKPYELTVGEQKINLKGDWQYKLGATMEPTPGMTFIRWKPVGLYNAMIAPLLKTRIKGVIWYQGEANTSKPEEYRELFPTMIRDWRNHWGEGDFPFLYVQLANFMETKSEPAESNWAQLRESQRQTLSLTKTGMAVTIDLGEWNDIHPLNKEEVGKRLALAAQKVAYGDKKIVSSGPVYQSMKVEGNKIILTFNNTGSGLVAKGTGELRYFAIAGADNKFVWAKAKIENNKVIVWNENLPNPVTIRYAWADNPEGANLYNKEGLPASPFTTAK
ncbi:sialate O-acetylesterase [Parabacteroides sp. FAFU027]|uniref:sialate O-acetylesterase n=1 Tax=Parabacteroides sp. FAFU027 TaxID=2922715 RepID=UPI001FAFCEF2|nr:sialate O-acetylesterase [Parabacteroides sp. FAFU027]